MEPSREPSSPDGDNVAIIILAAGLASRFWFPKLGMEVAGKSILRHVIEAAMATEVQEIILVLGAYARELMDDIPWDGRLRLVFNPRFAEGLSTSLAVGLSAVAPEIGAVAVLLGDQPLVRPQAIHAVIDRFLAGKPLAVAVSYNGQRGHPVLFARSLFEEFMSARGDEEAQQVLESRGFEVKYVRVPYYPPQDIDTLKDYRDLVREVQAAEEFEIVLNPN